MKYTDYILVGQGIAGSLLAWYLIKNKKTVILIDSKNESSASLVAAGIIHPITGRRIVKTWMADELLPFANDAYREIEIQFEEKILHPLGIVELLSNPKEYNDWMARSGEKELSGYIDNSDSIATYAKYLQPFYKSITVNRASWVNTGTLLRTLRNYFLQQQILIEEKFKIDSLSKTENGVMYHDISASGVIFCEGIEAMENPYWWHLPFLPSKGEVLTIRAEMNLDHILNRKIFIQPLGMNLFRVGSTYSWDQIDNLPSEAGKEFLISQLRSILKIPFEVVDHKAAIRPTVKDRRPFLGLHPKHDQIGIFNGLGTKGCLLAPYFAHHFAGYLSGKNELMQEVNVRKLNPKS
ncbi:MAG: FAD-dependent oxidoreductase [Bacteroidetes bacterium]|nr:FAD-dependent oxidoreductase [Bacteroidota bacterium]